MMIGFKIVHIYNKFLQYLGKRGVFENAPYPDPYTSFPQAKVFEENYNQILDEYLSFLRLKLPQPTLIQLGLYGGNHRSNLPWNKDTTEKEEIPDWTTIILKLGNKMIVKNLQYFPKTAELLKEMPNVGNVFFSQLGPQATINPHYGYLKGVLRYHLGIIIPENNLCHLEVDGVCYYWKPGESVVFDDMFLHAAYNKSNQTRVVLFIDFYRPLPFPYNWLNRQFLNLVSRSKFMKKAINKTNSF
ncbi:aspartyl/asparaginyl beta-hydroxylase domain-containing protein [Legionella drozanskii]|uniref:Peptide aspartate b-dioxygenase n=1 Tax=Legionella drozanskii LLAP-1 TaxID=1212489 RepID=A0A0W0TDV4_9GAMM|nr:aspartyl/asparaginyl beta-hydroxylase domain-containing protein [Legionella drozanskii]KTC93779.1 peptide aspartate b-dioxygenase [Legionella drozanskii LLAP-1]